jgi:hypothetical protein
MDDIGRARSTRRESGAAHCAGRRATPRRSPEPVEPPSPPAATRHDPLPRSARLATITVGSRRMDAESSARYPTLVRSRPDARDSGRAQGQPLARPCRPGGRRPQGHRGITAVLLANATTAICRSGVPSAAWTRCDRRTLGRHDSGWSGTRQMVKVNVVMIIIGFVLSGGRGDHAPWCSPLRRGDRQLVSAAGSCPRDRAAAGAEAAVRHIGWPALTAQPVMMLLAV